MNEIHYALQKCAPALIPQGDSIPTAHNGEQHIKRRAGLETFNAEVDSVAIWKKTDDTWGSERYEHRCISAGVMALARMEDE